MKAQIKESNLWIGLQAFIVKAEQHSGYGVLSDKAKRTLEWVFSRMHDNNKPIYIQEIVMKSGVASPATIHKSIRELMAMDLLRSEVDPSDSRCRRILVTSKASKMINKLAGTVNEWASSIHSYDIRS